MLYPFITVFLRKVLGLGYLSIGLLLIVVGIFPLLVSPFGGLITDRIGRRGLFLSMLGAEASCVALVAASMQLVFVPGIILAATGAFAVGSIAGPALSAYTADLTTVTERSSAFSWQRIGFNGGFTVGVAAGGSLIYVLGYAVTGLLAALFMGSSVVGLAIVLSPSPYDLARSKGGSVPDIRTAAGPSSIRDSVRILVNDRPFLLLCLAFLLAGLAEGQWATTLPLYLGGVLGLPTTIMGFALALNGLVVVLGQNQVTRWATGRLHTWAANVSILLYVVSYLTLGAIGLGSGWVVVAVIMAAIIVLTVGENFGAIPVMTMPSNLAPPTEIGSYNGAFFLFAGVGYVFAPALGGAALQATSNTLLAWALMMIPAVPAFILFDRLGRTLPKDTNTV
jgi:MFS family permease